MLKEIFLQGFSRRNLWRIYLQGPPDENYFEKLLKGRSPEQKYILF